MQFPCIWFSILIQRDARREFNIQIEETPRRQPATNVNVI